MVKISTKALKMLFLDIFLYRLQYLHNCLSDLGSGDEMIVPGDLEGFCNLVSSIWLLKGRHADPFVTIDI